MTDDFLVAPVLGHRYIVSVAPKQIRDWRVRRGLTQGELGKVLGVNLMTVYRWEAGIRQAPPFLHLALRCLELEGGDERKGVKAKRERR